MIGHLLDGRYKIIQVLGAGGFGETYVAENTRIPGNPKCVVKHLKPASNDPKLFATAKRLFQSEAESLAKLGSHDQIPRIVDFFDENQEFFLVQDLIEGHPLTVELAPGKRLSESYVLAFLKSLLPVLEFIHQQNVIHRDIKPANIIRRKQDSKLVLIDFGAVKQLQALAVNPESPESQQASVAIGTPGYMPTEQGRGKPRPSSDLYALGIIGIQALTGLLPTQLEDDPNSGEIIWQHHVSVSAGLAAILDRMVRYHFKDRYHSATEVLKALQQLDNPPASPSPGYQPTEVVAPLPTPTIPVSPSTPTVPVQPLTPTISVPPPTPPVPRQASKLLLVVGLVVLLGGGGALAAFFATQSSQPSGKPSPPIASRSPAIDSPSPIVTTSSHIDSPSPTISTSSPEEPSPNSSLTQEEAVQLIRNWLDSKPTVFGESLDSSSLEEYTTGEYYESNLESFNKQKAEGGVYEFGQYSIEDINSFSVDGDRASIILTLSENISFREEGEEPVDKSASSTRRWELRFIDEKWKIANNPKI